MNPLTVKLSLHRKGIRKDEIRESPGKIKTCRPLNLNSRIYINKRLLHHQHSTCRSTLTSDKLLTTSLSELGFLRGVFILLFQNNSSPIPKNKQRNPAALGLLLETNLYANLLFFLIIMNDDGCDVMMYIMLFNEGDKRKGCEWS